MYVCNYISGKVLYIVGLGLVLWGIVEEGGEVVDILMNQNLVAALVTTCVDAVINKLMIQVDRTVNSRTRHTYSKILILKMYSMITKSNYSLIKLPITNFNFPNYIKSTGRKAILVRLEFCHYNL